MIKTKNWLKYALAVLFLVYLMKKHIVAGFFFIEIYINKNDTAVVSSMYAATALSVGYKKTFYEYIARKSNNNTVKIIAKDIANKIE